MQIIHITLTTSRALWGKLLQAPSCSYVPLAHELTASVDSVFGKSSKFKTEIMSCYAYIPGTLEVYVGNDTQMDRHTNEQTAVCLAYTPR